MEIPEGGSAVMRANSERIRFTFGFAAGATANLEFGKACLGIFACELFVGRARLDVRSYLNICGVRYLKRNTVCQYCKTPQ